MRLVKYSLKEPRSNRSLDNLIDWEASSFIMDGYHLIGNMVTKFPHNLIGGEGLLIDLNGALYNVECESVSRTEFQFVAELRHQIMPTITEEASDGTTTITLSEPCTYRKSQDFCLYDITGEVKYTNCNFVEREDGTLIYGLINIPETYYANKITQEVQGGLYISDDLAFDWEKEEIYSGTTSITVVQQHITLRVGLEQQQEINLIQDDIYTNMMYKEIKSAVVGLPADMEKQIFEPYSGDTPIKEIEFKLHCRTRDSQNWKVVTTTEGGKEKWWNASGETADLITDLGFTEEEDVAFQKKRLKKSFLRLSFYDSTDRFSQNLLAYTTIFYDTNTAYSIWSKNRLRKEEDKEKIYASFTVTDRYNYLASSEGFYLYLYPDQLLKTSGDTIYMKAEFNNAKYGKIVNLFIPKNAEGKAILIKDDDFRDTYLVNDGDELYTDMVQLSLDRYSEIKLKYDSETGKYSYSFPWAEALDDKGKLTIHLIEPKGN